jgi:hypothetical protein
MILIKAMRRWWLTRRQRTPAAVAVSATSKSHSAAGSAELGRSAGGSSGLPPEGLVRFTGATSRGRPRVLQRVGALLQAHGFHLARGVDLRRQGRLAAPGAGRYHGAPGPDGDSHAILKAAGIDRPEVPVDRPSIRRSRLPDIRRFSASTRRIWSGSRDPRSRTACIRPAGGCGARRAAHERACRSPGQPRSDRGYPQRTAAD